MTAPDNQKRTGPHTPPLTKEAERNHRAAHLDPSRTTVTPSRDVPAEPMASPPPAPAVVPEAQRDVPRAETETEPARPPLSFGKIVAYSLANIGYGAFYALNNAVLPLFLKQFTQDARLIGLMGSTHSFEGAVIQPLVGSASDRLRTPMGRRRPFLLIFTPLSALFLLWTPAASHLPAAVRLAGMVTSIFLFTVFFNMAQDPYSALMPDITPRAQRGRVSGFSMFVLVLGQAGLVLLPTKWISLEGKFGITALLMLVTTLLTCALIREPPRPAETAHRRGHLQALRQALEGLRVLKQASRVLLALFFSGLGIGAVFPFLTVFVKTITGCSNDQAQQMFLILMIGTAVGVLPFGWLCDRIGPKRILLLGLGLMFIAALNGLWVTRLSQISLVMWLAGLGNAAQSAAAYPLLTSVVPQEEVGFYTGLQSTALSIATPLTAYITGMLVNGGGYRRIFAVCAGSLVVALLILASLQLRLASREIAVRDREQGRGP